MNKFYLITFSDEEEQVFEQRAETREEAEEVKEELKEAGWINIKIR